MPPRSRILISLALLLILVVISSCGNPYPQPEGLTPIPTLAPAEPLSLVTELQEPAVPASEVASDPEPGGGDPANGATVFAANCAACHGEGAEGGTVGPTLIGAAIAARDDGYFREAITNGVEGTAMPAWTGRLSAQEIEDVIASLRSLQ